MYKRQIICVFCSVNVFSQDDDGFKKGKYFNFIKENISIPINFRMDYTYVDYEKNFGDYQTDQRFQFSDFLVQVEGLLTKNIGYNFRFVFNSSPPDISGISADVQYANITYTTTNKRWFFQAGKGFLNVGTVEQEYDPNDVYIYGVVGNNLGVYKTGVTAQYNSKNGQSVGIQVLNSSLDSIGKQNNFEYNAYWYGSLVKGKVLPFMSATTILGTNTTSVTPYVINLGVQWVFDRMKIDTDYSVAHNMPNFYQNTTYTSVPVKILFDGDHFKPAFKYIYNKVKADDPLIIQDNEQNFTAISELDSHTFELALQYYPIKNKNLRVHLMGAYTTDQQLSQLTPNTGNNSFSRSHLDSQIQVIAGIRIGFDVLKGLSNL